MYHVLYTVRTGRAVNTNGIELLSFGIISYKSPERRFLERLIRAEEVKELDAAIKSFYRASTLLGTVVLVPYLYSLCCTHAFTSNTVQCTLYDIHIVSISKPFIH